MRRGFIEELLDSGRAMVMIDGLDEVPAGPLRDQVNKGISSFLNTYGGRGNLFIVTSRPLVKDPPFIADHKFREANIQPLPEDARDALIRRWLPSRLRPDVAAPGGRRILARADELIQGLKGQPPIARLATTPLLCAMLCARFTDDNCTLPKSEHELIGDLCDALILKRDAQSHIEGGDSPWDSLSLAQRLILASRIASHMIKGPHSVISRSDAKAKVIQELEGILRTRSKTKITAKRSSIGCSSAAA